jgi:hypothetical protein
MKTNNELEKYIVYIEVRDSEGKIILNDDGNKVIDITYETEMLTSNMEFNLRHLAKKLKAFMPDRQINIDVYVRNSISATLMNMYSFRVSEDKFVQH